MKKVVVLSGAGVSAESGIPTFRGADGLWEGYDIMEVASPEGWAKDQELVLRFYNERRDGIRQAQPNRAHELLAELDAHFHVQVITQNIDDLHERGGSRHVMHLHGEIFKARSTANPNLVYALGEKNIALGDTCDQGAQLRPHIVWFGEEVPMMEAAIAEALTADVLIVVGTSLVVYPAASLVHYVPEEIPLFVVDPSTPEIEGRDNLTIFAEPATTGMEKVKAILMRDYL